MAPAPQTSRLSRLNVMRMLVYYFAFLGLGATLVAIGPTLPDLAEQTGVTLAAAGFLFTIRSLGGIFGSTSTSWLYPRVRAHYLIALAMTILAVTMFLAPLIPSFVVLCIVLGVMGFGADMMQVSGVSSLTRMFRGNVAPYMNAQGVAFGIGMLIAPVLVIQLLLHTGELRYGYWVLALLFVPSIIAVLRLPDPAPSIEESSSKPTAAGYRMVIIASVFLALVVGVEVSVSGWVATYATTLDLMGRASAGLLTSAFLGMILLGRLVAIPLSDRLSPRVFVSFLLIGCFLSVAVLVLVRSNLALWAGVMALGLVFGPLFPTILGLVERRVHVTGSMNGIYFIGGAIGAMSFPWVAGQLFVNISPYTLFTQVLAMFVVAIVIFAVFLYPQRAASVEAVASSAAK